MVLIKVKKIKRSKKILPVSGMSRRKIFSKVSIHRGAYTTTPHPPWVGGLNTTNLLIIPTLYLNVGGINMRSPKKGPEKLFLLYHV